MGINEVISKSKNKIYFVKINNNRKNHMYLEKPVKDMNFLELMKEYSKKEKLIFGSESNLDGRNYELIEAILSKSKNKVLKLDYLVELLSDECISKNVKKKFIKLYVHLYNERELLYVLDKDSKVIDEQLKREIVRNAVDLFEEDILIKYFDFTNINLEYVIRVLNCLSIQGKVNILNRITNSKIQEKAVLNQVEKLEFEDAKQLYEKILLFDYNIIEEFYISQIRNLDGKIVNKFFNEIEYMSPRLAKEFDRVIGVKSVDETIEYINSNDVNKGGMIYLCKSFKMEDKQRVYDSLISEQDKKVYLEILN